MKYPRTSTEAFPCTTDYACALERPTPRPARYIWVIVSLLACASLGLVLAT